MPIRTQAASDALRPTAVARGLGVLAMVMGAGVGAAAGEGPAKSGSAISTEESPFTAEERAYWVFQPIRRPEIPSPRNAAQANNPIDAFVLHRLEGAGLRLSPPAGKRRLLRRAKFDLLGLPPTPDEIERFVDDASPDAYARLIDRFLASPHYGEHWGRKWLDLVRYAETAGFNADPLRPLAYKYRDYVVQAFNSGMPYDRFVHEQLAGDELFPDRANARIATGYNLMWPDESNASNVLLARQDALNDLTANVGSVFLGLSFGCAQCHDHKFDPILQTDFYRLQAFFTGVVPRESAALGTTEQLVAYQAKLDGWMTETAAVRGELHTLESTARAAASHIKRLKFPAVVLEAIDTAPEARTAFQQQLAFWSDRQIEVTEKQLNAQWSEEQKLRRDELKKQLEELRKSRPAPPRWLAAMVAGEVDQRPPKSYLLAGGGYDAPLEELQPGFLAIVAGADSAAAIVAPRPDTSGRRSALAWWLTDAANPLTARVMANRLWQGHFGRGIVDNANDFGSQTRPPSHPELLDWLAREFTAGGWDIKAMHHLLMTSATYQQSTYQESTYVESNDIESAARRLQGEPLRAAHREDKPSKADLREDAPPHKGVASDPGNRLYWRFPRRRLPAESIRDAILAVAGKLCTTMHGPPVKPELPPNFSSRHAWKPSDSEADRNRRSVYIHAKRNLPYPLLQVFDLPDMHESCAKRAQTTVAPQALMLLNSDMILGQARSFARRVLDKERLLGKKGARRKQLAALVRQGYLLAFGRAPEKDETDDAVAFIRHQQHLVAEAEEGQSDEDDTKSPSDSPLEVAVADFCHALLNANEFVRRLTEQRNAEHRSRAKNTRRENEQRAIEDNKRREQPRCVTPSSRILIAVTFNRPSAGEIFLRARDVGSGRWRYRVCSWRTV